MSNVTRYDWTDRYGMVGRSDGDYVFIDDYQELVSENKALREELAALKQSIPKIRADAVMDAKESTRVANTDTGQAWLCRVIDLENYANKIEAE
jgi:hypothetical protein